MESVVSFASMVEKPTWKEILLDAIHSKKLDPWNIDLTQVADEFISRIKKMETLDFVIPANVILAASILLRYKSDYFRAADAAAQLADFPMEEPSVAFEEVPTLSMVARIPPKSPITLVDLVKEMESIIRYEGEYVPKQKRLVDDSVPFVLPVQSFDIEKNMDALVEDLHVQADPEGYVLFSKIIEGKAPREIIYSLLSLLHLTQKEKVDLRQDQMFGEIFIHVRKEGQKSEKETAIEH